MHVQVVPNREFLLPWIGGRGVRSQSVVSPWIGYRLILDSGL